MKVNTNQGWPYTLWWYNPERCQHTYIPTTNLKQLNGNEKKEPTKNKKLVELLNPLILLPHQPQLLLQLFFKLIPRPQQARNHSNCSATHWRICPSNKPTWRTTVELSSWVPVCPACFDCCLFPTVTNQDHIFSGFRKVWNFNVLQRSYLTGTG